MLVQCLAELIHNLVNMRALCNKGRGQNSIIPCEFHMQAIPEHIFLHLRAAPTTNTIMM